MPAFGLMPRGFQVTGVVVLLAVVAGSAAAGSWQIQAWRFGRQLAEQASLHAQALQQLSVAALSTGAKTPALAPAFGRICSSCCVVMGIGFLQTK